MSFDWIIGPATTYGLLELSKANTAVGIAREVERRAGAGAQGSETMNSGSPSSSNYLSDAVNGNFAKGSSSEVSSGVHLFEFHGQSAVIGGVVVVVGLVLIVVTGCVWFKWKKYRRSHRMVKYNGQEPSFRAAPPVCRESWTQCRPYRTLPFGLATTPQEWNNRFEEIEMGQMPPRTPRFTPSAPPAQVAFSMSSTNESPFGGIRQIPPPDAPRTPTWKC